MNRWRVHKTKNYTMIDNTIFKDKRVSLKAKGLFATAMSLPPDWDFSIRGITTVLRESRDAVTTAIDELIACGYVTRERRQDDLSGTFGGWDYDFYERPKVPTQALPSTENPTSAKPATIKD